MAAQQQIRVYGAPRKDIDVELFIQALILVCQEEAHKKEGDGVPEVPPQESATTHEETGR